MIIIGSTAIRSHFPDFKRDPKDLDVVLHSSESTEDISKTLLELGIENPSKLEIFTYDILHEYCSDIICTPDILYTLKMSHLFWDINWQKHMFDVQFLKSKGCLLNKELFYKLYDFWNEYHSKNKRSDLKMSAEDFFDNAVKCDYKHDDLHTILKEIPTYTKVLIGEVEVGEDKFNELSFDEKCDLVTEEVMIMAWERYKKYDYKKAYSRMLKKFIISHAPLWEAIFIIENFIHLHKPSFNYYKKIENGLQTIKRVA